MATWFDWKAHYAKFRESQEWLQKRSFVIRRARGRCERCGLVFLSSYYSPEVHHLTYRGFTDNPKTPWPPGWDCDPRFLAALCGGPYGCHAFLHGKTDRDPMIWSQDSLAALYARLDDFFEPYRAKPPAPEPSTAGQVRDLPFTPPTEPVVDLPLPPEVEAILRS